MGKALDKAIRGGISRALESAPATPAAPADEPAEASAAASANITGSIIGGGNGFSGADSSKMRGMIYFPELDTRKEINPINRRELMRKARWLYANIGVVRRAINGVSRMVTGTGLIPEPFTTDKEWNELALAAFDRRTGSANVFDLAQKYNFKRSQNAMTRCRLRDGDMNAVLSNSQSGRARVGFYEAHQLGTTKWNYSTPMETEGWYDGIFTDRFNAAAMYRLLGDQPGEHSDISARDFIHHCDFERPGQRRAVTCLAHAINNMVDVTEIQSFIKSGIKQANRVGYYLADKSQPSTSKGIQAQISGAIAQEEDSSGNKVNIESIYGQGGEIPNVPAGKELRLLADQRPHPNTLGFLDWIIRDIAWGIGLPPELLWNIASLGGANTRYILADAQGFIEEQQQLLVDQYCHRVYVYTIAKEMKAGLLRRPTDPDWMFKCGWITPARVTVDFGRDGALHKKQLECGMLTFKQFYGWKGHAWKNQVEQWVDERAYMKQYAMDEHGLEMSEVMAILPSKATDDKTSEEKADNDSSTTDDDE